MHCNHLCDSLQPLFIRCVCTIVLRRTFVAAQWNFGVLQTCLRLSSCDVDCTRNEKNRCCKQQRTQLFWTCINVTPHHSTGAITCVLPGGKRHKHRWLPDVALYVLQSCLRPSPGDKTKTTLVNWTNFAHRRYESLADFVHIPSAKQGPVSKSRASNFQKVHDRLFLNENPSAKTANRFLHDTKVDPGFVVLNENP